MSDVAAIARRVAGQMLPASLGRPPTAAQLEEALVALRTLQPEDSDDQVALAEAGETVLLLRDALGEA